MLPSPRLEASLFKNLLRDHGRKFAGGGIVVLIVTVLCWKSAAWPGQAATQPASSQLPAASSSQGMLAVADFLPKGFATDGSVSYQTELQRAIDAAAGTGRTLVFPKMVCRLDE